MKHQIRSRSYRLALFLALATMAAAPSRADATVCTSLDPSRSGQPGAPIAIDMDVFTGLKKGLSGSNEIFLTTTNAVWTSFFHKLTTQEVKGYIGDPASIPTLHVGDGINVTRNSSGMGYRTLETALAPGSVVVVAVVSIDAAGIGTVSGFATLKVTQINGSGFPKFLDGTIVSLDLDPCFTQP